LGGYSKNKCKPWGVWVVGVMSENNDIAIYLKHFN